MATLNIASKANQAKSVPALLVAARVNNLDPNASINIKFQDADTLESGGGEAVELIVGTESQVYGSEKVITSLIQAYPVLQGKDEGLVSSEFQCYQLRSTNMHR